MKTAPLTDTHYADVARIYLEGIATGQATFQTEAYCWADWDKGHLQHSRMIATDDNIVVGWAALSPASSRCVYSGVAEVGIYVGADYRSKGVGNLLLQELIESSEVNEIWTLQAGIFPENTASIRLHEKNGFRLVGRREKIGKMQDTWRDTVLMERRSTKVGT